MTEHAMSFQRVAQEMHNRGHRLKQLRTLVHTEIMEQLEYAQLRFSHAGEFLTKVTQETDRRSHDMCNSIGHFVYGQHDIRKVVEDLARRIDVIQNGTYPESTSSSSKAAPGQGQTPPNTSVSALFGNRRSEEEGCTPQ